jgi:hypothetical protein
MTKQTALPRFTRTLLASSLLLAFAPAWAQETPTEQNMASVVVLGSRGAARTALDASAPVGLISAKDMQMAGPLELGKLMQTLDPSFNFSSTFISDGTDIIRPATLRSLGPDQLLVLVNGKRRHQQALVNVQQTIGRGSAGTDINAIPMSAIQRIEVLRDGAAAQYGSDAIAGVINIVLKQQTSETQLSGSVGGTTEGGGQLYSGSANKGWAIGDGGYVNLTVEGRRRGETNRAGLDTARVDPPRVTQRIGDSLAKDKYFWWNAALPVAEGAEFYSFGGVSHRTGDSAGFFRTAGDGRNVPSVYPNGFLPNIRTTVKDESLALGYRRDLADQWKFDVSLNHGRSELDFHEKETINISYWYEPKPGGGIYAQSPLEADTGKLKFRQTTVNADLRGPLAIGGRQVSFATGFEYRRDGYAIDAGDPVSYQYGRTNNPAIVIRDQTGGVAASGTQGFPGYTPGTEVDDSRHNIALYADLEHKLTNELLLGAAVRWEKYSDFGSTTTGKLSLRYDPSKTVGLRSTVSTGFRAPGRAAEVLQLGLDQPERGRRADRDPDRARRQRRHQGLRHFEPEAGNLEERQRRPGAAPGLELLADRRPVGHRHRRPHRVLVEHRAGIGRLRQRRRLPDQGHPRSAEGGPGPVLHQRHRHPDARPRHRGRAHHALAGFHAGAVRPAGLQPHQGEGPPLRFAGAQRHPAVRRFPGDPDRTRPAAPAPRAVGRLHDGRLERQPARQLLRRSAGPGLHRALRADLGGQVDPRRHAALQLQQGGQRDGRCEQPVQHLPDQVGSGEGCALPAARLHLLLGDLPVRHQRPLVVCAGGRRPVSIRL